MTILYLGTETTVLSTMSDFLIYTLFFLLLLLWINFPYFFFICTFLLYCCEKILFIPRHNIQFSFTSYTLLTSMTYIKRHYGTTPHKKINKYVCMYTTHYTLHIPHCKRCQLFTLCYTFMCDKVFSHYTLIKS